MFTACWVWTRIDLVPVCGTRGWWQTSASVSLHLTCWDVASLWIWSSPFWLNWPGQPVSPRGLPVSTLQYWGLAFYVSAVDLNRSSCLVRGGISAAPNLDHCKSTVVQLCGLRCHTHLLRKYGKSKGLHVQMCIESGAQGLTCWYVDAGE